MRIARLLFDAARHALPLASLYFLDGSVPRYLLLTAFNLSLGLVMIVGTTRAGTDPTTVDPRATTPAMRLTAALVLSGFFAVVAAFITIPIFAPVLIFAMADGLDWVDVILHKSFLVMLALLSLIAGMRAQLAFEAATVVGEKGTSAHAAPMAAGLEEDRARSKASYAAQVTIVFTFVVLAWVMINVGSMGVYVLPVAFAAVLVFYDTRPDLAQKLFPQLWQAGQPVNKPIAVKTKRKNKR